MPPPGPALWSLFIESQLRASLVPWGGGGDIRTERGNGGPQPFTALSSASHAGVEKILELARDLEI